MNTPSPSPPALSFATTFGTGGMATNQDNGTSSVSINENSASQVEVSTSIPPDKTSLTSKLQELEIEKEKAIAKFDGDIDALKRVLSFM